MMLDVALPSVRARHAIEDAWRAVDRLFGRLRGSEAEDYYRTLHDDWAGRLAAASATASDTVLPEAAAAAIVDLLETANALAVDDAASEEDVADWLETLPRTILTLVAVRPVTSAKIREGGLAWAIERLTNEVDNRANGWDTASKPRRRRTTLAA